MQEHQLVVGLNQAKEWYKLKDYNLLSWVKADKTNKINNNKFNKGRRSGGLVIYIKEEIADQFDIDLNRNNNLIQSITLNINNNKKININNVYVQPNGKKEDRKKRYNALSDFIKTNNKKNKKNINGNKSQKK